MAFDPTGINWATATPQQLAQMSQQLTAQGVDQAQQARMAQQAGVSRDTINTASAQNSGFGRMAIDNAYSPGNGTLNDSQQMWNAQHSGAGSRNEATGGDYSWNDKYRVWERPNPTGGQNIGGAIYYGPNGDNTGSMPGNNSYSTNLGFGSGSGGGGGSVGSMAGGSNPYLQGMGKTIVDQMTENYTRNQLPASRSGAMAAGGFGGSRQGVVEANGLNDLNRGIGQNLTNLYGQDWTNAQNRGLQQQSINNSYDLGIRGNDLGYANLDSNNQQFGANYGLNLMNAQNNWAQQGVQNANGIQNAPIDYSRYFNGQSNQIGGQGGTQTNTQTNPGNPWIGAVGGAQLANSWFNGRG